LHCTNSRGFDFAATDLEEACHQIAAHHNAMRDLTSLRARTRPTVTDTCPGAA
jgi:hypothetical protein